MVQRNFCLASFFYLLLGLFFSSCGLNDYGSKNTSPQPQQYVPVYVPVYQPYSQPYSNSYKNPYESPPRNYYPYYDQDYYYVPPTQHRYIEHQGVKFNQGDSVNEKL